METTRIRRHIWIWKDHPIISEIVDRFPHLKSGRWVYALLKYYLLDHIYIEVGREFKSVVCLEGDTYTLLDK